MTDHGFPALEMRAVARRMAVPAAIVAVAVAVVVAAGPLRAFADALARALDADPRWVAAAAAFELLSFAGYVALLWLVGGRATPRLGLRAAREVTLGGAAATRLLPTAGVGGAALTLWALHRSRAGRARRRRARCSPSSRPVRGFPRRHRAAGGRSRSGSPRRRPARAERGARRRRGGWRRRRAGPRRATAAPADAETGGGGRRGGSAPAARRGGVLGAAVRDALALVRSGDPRLLGAPAWWAFDAAVLWAMLHALGAPPALAVLVLAYFVGQVGNTIPIPGAVSGGMVGVLLAFGVDADLALAAVLAYRAVAIWLPAPIGLAALGRLRRTFARWTREDAAHAATPAPATPAHHLTSVPIPPRPAPEPALQRAA